MNITTANRLYEDGTLRELYKAGFISYKIFTYREIYLYVDLLKKTKGISQEKAVLEAQVKFNKSRTLIYKAIYLFSSDLCENASEA